MANYDTAAWAELKLVRRLKSIDENMWYDISQQINKVAPLLSWRPIGLEEYTDHDINHCYRVLKALGNIIPDTFILTKYELEILIYAVVFHDIGMWTKKGEVEKSLSDEQFQSYFKKQNSYSTIKNLIDSNAVVDSNLGYLLLRQVVANYHRSHHPERSAIMLNNMVQDLYLDSRISEEKLRIIANVCAAHGWELDEVLVSDLLEQYRLNIDTEVSNESEIIVDVRLIAFFLRIGDLLDLDAQRISTIVRAYLEPLSPESEAHWKKHQWLYFQRLNSEIIEIRGNFNYDKHGSIAVDAFNLAKAWCDYLNNDIMALKKALHFPERYDLKKGRKIGELLLDVTGIKAEGIVFSDKLSFIMDKDRIMEILGDEIYDDKSAFVRELIQNAIDATRTKLVDDYHNGKFSSYYNLDLRTPNAWPREITSNDNYAIHITTGKSIVNIAGDDQELLYFEIRDSGIGMSIKQIKDYFLQIGKSYYRSKEFLTNYKHSSISRFGIGFLTCLIVAKKIVLFTKSQKEGEGIRLDMDSESNLISAVKDDNIDFFGSKVRIYFKAELTEEENWLPGIPQRIDKDKLYSIIHSEMLHASKLEQAVSYWIPWCEFKITVNNRERMPKSPMDLANNERYWSVPFYVQSVESKEKLATGVFVSPKTHCIPTVDNYYRRDHSFLPSIGGVAIPPWEEQRANLTYIDLFRQPNSIITASRRAKFKIPSEEVRKCIAEQIVLAIDDTLGKSEENIGYRALFRASLGIDISDFDLLLPVLRDGIINWEFWDEKRFRTTDCVLVPFFLPLIKRNLQCELPIVGVPRRTAFGPSSKVPQIREVSAIVLNNCVTGALSGPSKRYNLQRLEKGYTFLLYRLCGFNNKKGEWEKVNDDFAIQSPIRNQMYSWDLESDRPWSMYGFDADKEESWYIASKYLKNQNFSNYSLGPVCIDVNVREWNFLNRYQPEDVYGQILIDLILRGCE